jgi:hypothetical protein
MADVSQATRSTWLPMAATLLFGGAVAAATFAATRYAYQQELERRFGAVSPRRCPAEHGCRCRLMQHKDVL